MQILTAARLIKFHLECGDAGPATVSCELENQDGQCYESSIAHQASIEGWLVHAVHIHIRSTPTCDTLVDLEVVLPMRHADAPRYSRLQCGAKAIRTRLYNTSAITFGSNSQYHVTVGSGLAGFKVRHLQYLYTLLLKGGESILHRVHPPYGLSHEDARPCKASSFYLRESGHKVSTSYSVARRPAPLRPNTTEDAIWRGTAPKGVYHHYNPRMTTKTAAFRPWSGKVD